MSLTPGSRFGPYEITAQIGVGGMGVVYRAIDTNLKRQVAIKVLPASVSGDPDRLARFQREAELLASLNHPNIASIYGLERLRPSRAEDLRIRGEGSASVRAGGGAPAPLEEMLAPIPLLVMELVDGPTLADRIAQGPIPIDEALAIARQIAEALEAAHDRWIIHRDLKPANIKLRPDGTVKVLDFGLAKAIEPASLPSPDLSHSPTLTTPAMTEVGMILGTAAYMSPEQARGRPIDKRSDIWAFGCVLYEMLTARPAFKVDDVSETLAGVLRDDVDWGALPPGPSPLVKAFLVRCLAKDPRQRIHDIGDLRLALEGAFDAALAPPVHTPVPSRRSWMWLAGVAVLAATAAALAMWMLRERPAPVPAARLNIALPPGQIFYFNGRDIVAISPQGTHVAFTAGLGLWLRSLNELEAKPVPGAELEGRSPFFSPDGQSIAFYAGGELKRVSVTGGAPVTVAKVVNPWGGTWGEDDVILYGQGPQGVWKVPARGGTPERIIEVGDGEMAHRPQMLPGGEWVLFTLLPKGIGSWNRARIVVQSLQTKERLVLVDGGRDAHYLPSGHLVYGLNNELLAVRFNAGTRRVSGGAVPLVTNVFDAGSVTGAVHFDIAASGSLVYVPRIDSALRLTWVDRNGREEVIPAAPKPYRHPRVSPDGTRIAVAIEAPGNSDVWIGDSRRGTFTQLTRSDDDDTDPIWAPDGTQVVFTSARGREALFRQPVDGGGVAQHLADGAGGVRALTWTPDGKLGYEDLAGTDLKLVPLAGGAPQHIKVFDDPQYFNELLPALSPDGRWVAYQSTESDRMEIYVRPFPNVDAGQWQISAAGGHAPLWSHDGREIYYRGGPVGSTALMAVQVQTTPNFKILSSSPLFNLAAYVLAGTRGIRYDVARDGRFLLLKGETGDSGTRQDVVIVQNWIEELKRRVPTR